MTGMYVFRFNCWVTCTKYLADRYTGSRWDTIATRTGQGQAPNVLPRLLNEDIVWLAVPFVQVATNYEYAHWSMQWELFPIQTLAEGGACLPRLIHLATTADAGVGSQECDSVCVWECVFCECVCVCCVYAFCVCVMCFVCMWCFMCVCVCVCVCVRVGVCMCMGPKTRGCVYMCTLKHLKL